MTRAGGQGADSALARWWSGLASRERRLVLALAGVGALCVIVGFRELIHGGLEKRRKRNHELAEAIRTIDRGRPDLEARKRKQIEIDSLITDTSVNLLSYLEKAATDAKLPSPNYTPEQVSPKGRFLQKQIAVSLKGVSLEQLSKYLQAIESESRSVVVQKLEVKTFFGQHQRLEADLTVTAFERAKKPAAASPKPAAPEGGT